MFVYLASALFLAVITGAGFAVLGAEQPQVKPVSEPPTVLEFDLSSNWGLIPMAERRTAALAELASGIPGLARALAVHWWSVWRGGEPVVGPDEAAVFIGKEPELCRLCQWPDDAAKSTAQLSTRIKAKYPVPTDRQGWESGSFGLGRILGATAVYAGAEDAKLGNGFDVKRIPLLGLPAKATMERPEVQAWLAGVLTWRFLNHATLKPRGADAANTWGNIFSIWTDRAAYEAGEGLSAKQNYLQRAKEVGIDLDKLAQPNAKQSPLHVWSRIKQFKDLEIVNIGVAPAPAPKPEPKGEPKDEDAPKPVQFVIKLPGGFGAQALQNTADAASALPMIIMLHERGGDISQFGPLALELPANVRAFALRGPVALPKGFAYFNDGIENAKSIHQSSLAVDAAIRALLTKHRTSRLVLLGHGQGGAVALHLAAMGLADATISVGAMLPADLFPKRPSQASVWMLHGMADTTVTAAKAQATSDAFAAVGFASSWSESDGGHALADFMSLLPAEVAAALQQSDNAPGFEWTPSCELKINDLGQMMRWLVPRVVDTATAKTLPVTAEALGKAAFGHLTSVGCALVGKIQAVDVASAEQQYLLERQVLQTLILRGQIAPEVAATLGDKARNTAIKAGVDPDPNKNKLPALEM